MSDTDVMRLGLVHTVPALGAVFHDLVLEAAGADADRVEIVHVTDPWLLHTAMNSGVTPGVLDRLTAHVDHLAGPGAAAVLVTCSSLGEATEQVAARLAADVPLVRVDQALADRAVELAGPGGRIAVLATVASTVGPTVRVVERSAARGGASGEVSVEVLDDARMARAAGDVARHDALIAAAAERCAEGGADVVVLAQASMAGAAGTAAARGVPVLSSPELAARRLIDVAR